MSKKDHHPPGPPIDVKQYGGKQVAIVDGKIVAAGRTLDEVLRKAQAQYPERPLSDIGVLAVPKSIYVIYHA
jgi:hypothetical protein